MIDEIDDYWAAGFAGVPTALAKATCDEFSYALGLRNGTVVYFQSAKLLGGDWLELHGSPINTNITPFDNYTYGENAVMSFDRGIQVRISEIAWAADAPFGS